MATELIDRTCGYDIIHRHIEGGRPNEAEDPAIEASSPSTHCMIVQMSMMRRDLLSVVVHQNACIILALIIAKLRFMSDVGESTIAIDDNAANEGSPKARG